MKKTIIILLISFIFSLNNLIGQTRLNKPIIVQDTTAGYSLFDLINYKWSSILEIPTPSHNNVYVSITWLFFKNGSWKLSTIYSKTLNELVSKINDLKKSDFCDMSAVAGEERTYAPIQDLNRGYLRQIVLIGKPESIGDLSDSLLVFSYPSKENNDSGYNIYYIREDKLSDLDFVKRHISDIPRDSVKRIRGLMMPIDCE